MLLFVFVSLVGLPFVMVETGLFGGIGILIFMAFLTHYSSHLMIYVGNKCQAKDYEEMEPKKKTQN